MPNRKKAPGKGKANREPYQKDLPTSDDNANPPSTVDTNALPLSQVDSNAQQQNGERVAHEQLMLLMQNCKKKALTDTDIRIIQHAIMYKLLTPDHAFQLIGLMNNTIVMLRDTTEKEVNAGDKMRKMLGEMFQKSRTQQAETHSLQQKYNVLHSGYDLLLKECRTEAEKRPNLSAKIIQKYKSRSTQTTDAPATDAPAADAPPPFDILLEVVMSYVQEEKDVAKNAHAKKSARVLTLTTEAACIIAQLKPESNEEQLALGAALLLVHQQIKSTKEELTQINDTIGQLEQVDIRSIAEACEKVIRTALQTPSSTKPPSTVPPAAAASTDAPSTVPPAAAASTDAPSTVPPAAAARASYTNAVKKNILK